MGERDYHKMLGMVLQFSNEHRLMEGRGQKDMDVDSAESEAVKYTADEWEAWQAEELDYMGKGKGGKGGKGGGKGKGKGKGGGGKGKGKEGKETRICHWCQKVGHLIAECRAKAAGKPKVKPAAGAASLEDDAWEEDLPADGLDSVELQDNFSKSETGHAHEAAGLRKELQGCVSQMASAEVKKLEEEAAAKKAVESSSS